MPWLPLIVRSAPAVLLVPVTTFCTPIDWATGEAASAAPRASVAAADRLKIRSVDQSKRDAELSVRSVPSVVSPDAPPNTPLLLYWSCVLEPAGAVVADAHVPSPRQNVEADALVPLLRFVTGRFPVTPVVKGKPVQLVSVPDDGVPSAPLNVTKAPADPTLMPRAVTTPVPVVVVAGATPAPPPNTMALAASTPDDVHVEALLKYGMPPEVPATVSAKVPADVIGEPPTEIRPPVNVCATLVTDPTPAAAHVPSPRQNVEDVAPVPEFRFVTGKFPVTPVVRGSPVAFVRMTADGVPSAGVINVGLVVIATEPVPLIAYSPTIPALS